MRRFISDEWSLYGASETLLLNLFYGAYFRPAGGASSLADSWLPRHVFCLKFPFVTERVSFFFQWSTLVVFQVLFKALLYVFII